MASYERINYALRPAKNIERKMIAEALRRLRAFASLRTYRYIGLGSTYFSDFALFHKALDIQQMTSIEEDDENAGRFEFNVPFGCIDMAFGHSTDVLPTLDWEARSIVWLDYDGPLNGGVLADIRFVTAEAEPGSVLIVTVNAHPTPLNAGVDRVEKLRESVGPENVPADVRVSADLGGWKVAAAYRKIIDNTIASTLRDRNAGTAQAVETEYLQLFNFQYRDNARMLTAGGLLFRADQSGKVDACAFDDFSYVRRGVDPYRIEVPNLTFREMRHLNEQLPRGDELGAHGVPEGDVRRYETVYRYFPAFVDAEI